MNIPKIVIQKSKADGLILSVDWPGRIFPADFEIQNPKLHAWGYLADYDSVGIEKSIKMLFSDKNRELMNSSNDFLLVVYDKINDKVKIATSVSAMFPLYFAEEDGQMILSPDFGCVFRRLKKPNLDIDGTLDYFLSEYSMFCTDITFIDKVRRLPAGCVLTIDKDLKWRIDEPFRWKGFFANSDLSPMKPKEFTNTVIETLGEVIDKRLKVVSRMPLSCEMSSGFDCDLVAYLLKELGSDFTGFSYYTRLNNHDTDVDLVEKFAQKHKIKAHYADLTDLVFFSTDEELEWNVKHLFPGMHSLSMYLKFEKGRRNLLGDNFISFTGQGGDEFLHSRSIVDNDLTEWRSLYDFAKINMEGGAGDLLVDKMCNRLVDEERWRGRKIYGNTIGGAAGHQIFFPLYWQFTGWLVNPFDDLELLKLAPRIPVDDKGEPLHKHELFKDRTDIFLPEQFRVKLPYHEQAVRYLELSVPVIEKILANSIFGKMGWINIDAFKKAIQNGKLQELVGDNYLMFGNILRLEVFLQGNGFMV